MKRRSWSEWLVDVLAGSGHPDDRLVATSGLGLAVLIIMTGAVLAGAGGLLAWPLLISAAAFVLPLFELWTRRRARQGKTTFDRLRRLDERFAPRKR